MPSQNNTTRTTQAGNQTPARITRSEIPHRVHLNEVYSPCNRCGACVCVEYAIYYECGHFHMFWYVWCQRVRPPAFCFLSSKEVVVTMADFVVTDTSRNCGSQPE